ncbi:MAG: hypothetical protein U1E81_23395 [Xanthobacteraceae bacterium]
MGLRGAFHAKSFLLSTDVIDRDAKGFPTGAALLTKALATRGRQYGRAASHSGHFPAKHALGLDPGVGTGSPEKYDQSRKTGANSDSMRTEFGLAHDR